MYVLTLIHRHTQTHTAQQHTQTLLVLCVCMSYLILRSSVSQMPENLQPHSTWPPVWSVQWHSDQSAAVAQMAWCVLRSACARGVTKGSVPPLPSAEPSCQVHGVRGESAPSWISSISKCHQ